MSKKSLQHRFSQIPSADIPRSSFNRTHCHKTTFDSGFLIPFYVDEALPGDTFNLRATLFARLATPMVPIMDNIYMDTFYFAVPIRLIWENWQKFNGEQENPGDSTDFLVPTVSAPSGGWQVGSLSDYFGLPTGVDGIEVDSLWHRAYNLIWNEWFRDENLQDSVEVPTGDGPDSDSDFVLLRRGKRHDYFTSCLPWPQKGPGVELPLGSVAPVTSLSGQPFTSDETDQIILTNNLHVSKIDSSVEPLEWVDLGPMTAPMYLVGNASTSTNAYSTSSPAVTSVPTGDGVINGDNPTSMGMYFSPMNNNYASGLTFRYASRDAEDPLSNNQFKARFADGGLGFHLKQGDLVADLSGATSATINSLRQAFQIQRLLERDARGGTRYTEILRAHFGVKSPDARLQRPEYLGGSSVSVRINPVAQTASTDTVSPQGNLAAFGLVSDGKGGFSKSFVEHCVIIGLVSVRADLTYQQGIPRMFSRQTRYDFYWPALAHLGEQAVLNKEIFAQGTSEDDDVFGYQERWAEYRYFPNKVTGKFRSSYDQSLDIWHLAQYFENLPALNSDFIQDNPPISRIMAVPSEPQFLFDSFISLKCARPMPVYSVPGLIDHF